ncbi:MAG: TonB-dependent receptor [Alphaproteobacteria bacterium]|nr:TonB-dependent receptor [Alphaproteobacteria bacterium]
MNGNRIALTAALLATTGLVPVSAAYAQDSQAAAQADQVEDTIVVRYQYVPDDKRVTSEVSSFLSADDIAVTGDSDIASALGRITGLSVQDGRFVIVRGLNERYSNTLINGSPLASPEPFRRAVPLDLFPTSLISNVLVQKTFSPQFPGEFGGGLVQIETSALPAEGFLELGFSFAADTATSFDDGLMHDGDNLDYTGFGGSLRDFPRQYLDIFNTQNIGNQDPTTLAEIGRALPNSQLWVVQEGDVPGDVGFDISLGDRYDFDGFSIGVLASVGYDNSWQTREGVRATSRFQGDGLAPIQQFDRYSTENTIESNGLFSVGLETGNHELQALALVLRSSDKGTQIQQGFDETGNTVREDQTSWFERQVYTYQLSGEHLFESIGQGLEIEWRASTADASREAPNQRRARYRVTNPNDLPQNYDYVLLGQRTGNTISFSRVDEVTEDLGIDFTLPTTILGRDVEWKAGYSTLSRERTAYSRQFFFDGSIPAGLNGSRIDYVLADQNILQSRFFLREVGGLAFPEAYRGELEVDAAYVGADAELTPFLRAALGVRFEDGEQTLESFAYPVQPTAGNPDGINPITPIAEDYVLPAATLTWTFADNLQLRLGYSETITRPQFRELGFSQFVDTDTDELFQGNPYLINSELTNYDARLEYYFGRDQFATVGVFHKEIENPIVEYLLPTGENLSTSFINAPEATLTGFEVEYEKRFDLADWFDGDFWSDAELFIKTNYTYTSSEMSVSANDQVILAAGVGGVPSPDPRSAAGFIADGQTLQGQSEHLANFQIGWEDSNSRTALLYTYTGERTRALQNLAPGEEQPEIIEQPPQQLDLVHSRFFEAADGGEYSLRFAVRNLLGEDYEAYQERGGDRLIVDSYEIGTTFSINVSRTF